MPDWVAFFDYNFDITGNAILFGLHSIYWFWFLARLEHLPLDWCWTSLSRVMNAFPQCVQWYCLPSGSCVFWCRFQLSLDTILPHVGHATRVSTGPRVELVGAVDCWTWLACSLLAKVGSVVCTMVGTLVADTLVETLVWDWLTRWMSRKWRICSGGIYI